MKQIITHLFNSNALAIAPKDTPFWYTSGKLGPFYINTHYLAGGEKRASDLLEKIEHAALQPSTLVNQLMAEFLQELDASDTFRQVIQSACDAVKNLEFDIISGGERRDWFFSLPMAYHLKKPHLSILKDGTTWLTSDVSQPGEASKSPNLNGQSVLHVADIITEASSFTRQWIPAIRGLEATVRHAFAILDRNQGGRLNLLKQGVTLHTLGEIDADFFQDAKAFGYVDEEMRQSIEHFLLDPEQYLRDFLNQHPNFLTEQQALGGQNAKRVDLLLNHLGLVINI